jgi:3'-phosphoadenosine 5'-phosphosulfate sulfotransferase (PAPS reductase)/FAD synthetase
MKHIVGFSGGIDSQACARWVLNRFPAKDVILTNSNAGGNEHPMTVEFIDWYSENVHPVVRIESLIVDMDGRADAEIKARGLKPTDPLDFPTLAELKQTFPRRRMQFCTDHLKLQPQLRWIRENINEEFRRYSGVRREESQNRQSRQPTEFDSVFSCELWHPLVDWTKQMCFDYVKFHGEQINPLYTLGFERVGCAPCINSGKSDVLAWATRFPEMIDKVRQWEQRVGKTFFGPMTPRATKAAAKHKEAMEVWRAEMVGRDDANDTSEPPPKPVRPPEAINWIDDVVKWSKTTRGGSQLAILYDRESCESSYGLCE